MHAFIYLSGFCISPWDRGRRSKVKGSAKKMKAISVDGFELAIFVRLCWRVMASFFIPGRNSGVSVAQCVSLQLIWHQGQVLFMDDRLVSLDVMRRHRTVLWDASDGWQPFPCRYCLCVVLSFIFPTVNTLPFCGFLAVYEERNRTIWLKASPGSENCLFLLPTN